MTLLDLPPSIRLVEVGLRDGLQAVSQAWRTQDKVAIIEQLIGAGVREIEAVSFAHPKLLPQLADAEAVMTAAPRVDGVRYRGLVPNLRGAQRAVDCGLDEWVFVVPADDDVALRNQQRTTNQLLHDMAEIANLAKANDVRLVVAVACAFFAPARGPVPPENMHAIVNAAVNQGCPGVYLAGTSGQEHPVEIANGIGAVRRQHPDLEIGVHLHNRNGFAPANALLAMVAGASWLEASFAGLGGDLWFPGHPTVLGNAPTEDVVHLCNAVGIETEVDLTTYLKVVRHVETLTGVPSTSFVTRGGTRADLATATWPDSSSTR